MKGKEEIGAHGKKQAEAENQDTKVRKTSNETIKNVYNNIWPWKCFQARINQTN